MAAAAIAVLAIAACGSPDPTASDPAPGTFEGRGPITYVAHKDTTGTLQQQLDQWNAAHPDEPVTFIELPSAADEQRQQFVQNALTRSDAYAVLSMDTAWFSEFAANRWIDPLPRERLPVDEHIPATVATAVYRGQLYGLPETTDAGMLFYRTDLLAAAGVSAPPRSFDEMWAACEQVLALPQASGMSCYAGQFDKYEGLTVNVSEAVSSAGGAIVDDDGHPAVDSPEAVAGLDALARGFAMGLIPPEAITFKEEEGRRAFQEGKLVFLRQWPYAYALAARTDGSSPIAGRFGVSPLPGLNGRPGVSALGGKNLAISAFARNKATALDFLTFFASADAQRERLTLNSLAPTIAALYDDPAMIELRPYLPVLEQAVLGARQRPAVVAYGELTAAVQERAYAALTGRTTAAGAMAELQSDLTTLLQG